MLSRVSQLKLNHRKARGAAFTMIELLGVILITAALAVMM